MAPLRVLVPLAVLESQPERQPFQVLQAPDKFPARQLLRVPKTQGKFPARQPPRQVLPALVALLAPAT
ncbi:MAG TPA: hypothetical protein V6C52_08885 [Coleofasciculaceae cyanobacterium]